MTCPDAKGVVAALSQLLYGLGCNIISSDQCVLVPVTSCDAARGQEKRRLLDQEVSRPSAPRRYTDLSENVFFQRIAFDYSELLVGPANTAILENAMENVSQRFVMKWWIHYSAPRKRMAILVSKSDHCLYDLLIRKESGELNCEVRRRDPPSSPPRNPALPLGCDPTATTTLPTPLSPPQIPVIISNHADLEHVASKFGVPFRHLPLDAAAAGGAEAAKAAQEAALERILEEEKVELVVLARYMQVLSRDFCERNAHRTINIHHSFLPAFEGARPYHRAHERGVKIIGATAHYATADLDCGPIIEQDVTRISHRDSVATMVRKGKDLERLVLARAVAAHLGNRVIVHGNRTVVFDEASTS